MVSEDRVFIGGGCCCAILIALVIMLSVSFKKIESNTVGLRSNKWYGYVNSEEVHQTGVHYVGLWHTFQTVSKTQQYEEYQVTAFTKNIIQVKLSVSIQYQIEPTFDTLYKILYDYDDMDAYFDSRTQDAIRRGIQSLSSDVLYNSRSLVTATLRDNVKQAIDDIGYNLNNLQIKEIRVPTEMQDAINSIVDAKLNITVAVNERNKLKQSAQNERREAVHAANITAIQAALRANADFEAAKVGIDADFYMMKQSADNLKALILAYQESYTTATPQQIMDIVKAHRYNNVVNTVGVSGSNKVFIDHKPSAINEVSNNMKSILSGVSKVEL